MLSDPYRAVTDRYPGEKLPSDLLGTLENNGFVRVIVQRLDDNGEVVDGHPYQVRTLAEAVDPEDVVDYIPWMRGHI